MKSAFKKRLKNAKKNWKKGRQRHASGDTNFGNDVPDGRYLAKLTAAEVGESQSSGRLQIMWTWKILEGDYKGETCFDFDGLETEDNLMWLAKKLETLGYESPEDLEEIEELLEQLLADAPTFRIRLRTKGEFQNVLLDKPIESGEDEDDEDEDDADESESDDDEEDEDEDEESDDDEDEDEEDADEEEEDEDDEEVEEDDEPDVEKGDMVQFKHKKKTRQGKVIKLSGDQAKVKLQSGTMVTVDVDILEVLDLNEPPKKAKKSKKK
jgi:hypothetical protein